MNTNSQDQNLIKLIAFYLPQFHPTPENDLWWGKGFTEWTNVTKAGPLFAGHYQPHLPTDTGFYDLRVKETRLDQIRMAKDHGIAGFCYHYYWFSGTRILNQPVDAMLADPDHDMPFCLCWANENWTRQWDAAEHEILIAQKYAPEDDLNFIKGLIPFFEDARYIRLNGKPFIIVYRPQHLPNSKNSIEVWRQYCREAGIGEIHVCCALTHGNMDHVEYGFDSGVEFPPHNLSGISSTVDKKNLEFYSDFSGTVVQYQAVAELFLNREYSAPNVFRSVFPSWDNTARRGRRSFVVLNGTPENYEYWLKETVAAAAQKYPGEERLVFINAWNEWAEGCHLEPDRIHGKGFLDATRRVQQGISAANHFPDVGMPSGNSGFFEQLVAKCNAFRPELLSSRCFWLSHLPFVHWLVSNQAPKLAVVVNADTGNAPLNIANSAQLAQEDAKMVCSVRGHTLKTLQLKDNCSDGLEVLESTESTFLEQFEAGSIDLLVLDDFNSQEELEKTFLIGLQKLSSKGIVFLHDIFVHDNPMFKFWDAIKADYPSFSFERSHGLGVLLIGQDVHPSIHRLVDSDVANTDWNIANLLFGVMGESISISVEKKSLTEKLNSVEQTLSQTQHNLSVSQEDCTQLVNAYNAVVNSSSWKATAPIRQLLNKIR